MIDILITLIPLVGMAVYFYGLRVVVMLLIALLTAVVTDAAANLLLGKRKWEKYDLSFLVTAVIYTLVLPATAPYWMVVLGVILALMIAKAPFGGFGKNIFNPAAFAAAFMIIGWPDIMVKYPDIAIGTPIGLESVPEVATSHSTSFYLLLGGAPNLNLLDALLGNFAGPMGVTCILVMSACALYLLVRKTLSWQIPVGAFSMVLFFALVFPTVSTGWIPSIIYELVSGVLFFGIIFMASDPVTSPKTGDGKLVFGLLLGLLAMLFRRFGSVELSFVFALLLMNALSDLCDIIGAKTFGRIKWGKKQPVKPGVEADE